MMKVTLWASDNTRAGQWSRKGVMERIRMYGIPDESIKLEGNLCTFFCNDRATIDRILRRIDTYAGCRVARIFEKV